MSPHPIVHIEFPADDPAAAARFYGELFGWKVSGMPDFDYYLFDAAPGPGGGFPRLDEQQGIKAGDVVVYIDTDDIEASLAKAEALGGKTLVKKTEIPGQGWFAFFRDPTGNRVGVFTALPRAG